MNTTTQTAHEKQTVLIAGVLCEVSGVSLPELLQKFQTKWRVRRQQEREAQRLARAERYRSARRRREWES